MPLLAGYIGSIFTALFTFLATYVGKKVAVIVAATAMFLALTIGMITAITALATGAFNSIPIEWTSFIGLFMPENTFTVLSVILTARIARYVYDANLYLMANVWTD